MTAFSANLGFLWSDLPLPEAIRAAARAGFDAVECHWPYAFDPAEVRAALDQTGLVMLGLNTNRGQPGQNGLAALPGQEVAARAEIDRAIAYAREIDCGAIHVMAGFASGAEAEATFIRNLTHACRAAPDLTFLIEPLNHRDAPGYFLTGSDQARDLITRAGLPNLRLMFDCYHLQIMEGDISCRLETLLPLIGHIQIAAVPDRGPPDQGELDYRHVIRLLRDLGWDRPLGAEYRPEGATEASLGWLQTLRA
ncbi:hydroxypyruvate isomerase family protein [Paracoccus fistulariae]|uniref:TIM barrel protein n=1 Tax=Paracoccus fistulariae TaxID=658446 RepID=A0ABY7SNX6_9RHOB|nr:TIM barrel protein [Paracoccus fistulariae]MDB6182445.1 TIM barrel protein [Paracoccus fistulariae]WCR08584.1 TIM barrel protein [Paracoccus fistulariae]